MRHLLIANCDDCIAVPIVQFAMRDHFGFSEQQTFIEIVQRHEIHFVGAHLGQSRNFAQKIRRIQQSIAINIIQTDVIHRTPFLQSANVVVRLMLVPYIVVEQLVCGLQIESLDQPYEHHLRRQPDTQIFREYMSQQVIDEGLCHRVDHFLLATHIKANDEERLETFVAFDLQISTKINQNDICMCG